jgi:hypothetical protein
MAKVSYPLAVKSCMSESDGKKSYILTDETRLLTCFRIVEEYPEDVEIEIDELSCEIFTIFGKELKENPNRHLFEILKKIKKILIEKTEEKEKEDDYEVGLFDNRFKSYLFYIKELEVLEEFVKKFKPVIENFQKKVYRKDESESDVSSESDKEKEEDNEDQDGKEPLMLLERQKEEELLIEKKRQEGLESRDTEGDESEDEDDEKSFYLESIEHSGEYEIHLDNFDGFSFFPDEVCLTSRNIFYKKLLAVIMAWPKEATFHYSFSEKMLIKEFGERLHFYKKKARQLNREWKKEGFQKIEERKNTVLYNLVKHLTSKAAYDEKRVIDILLSYKDPQEAIDEFLFNSGAQKKYSKKFSQSFADSIKSYFEQEFFKRVNLIFNFSKMEDPIKTLLDLEKSFLDMETGRKEKILNIENFFSEKEKTKEALAVPCLINISGVNVEGIFDKNKEEIAFFDKYPETRLRWPLVKSRLLQSESAVSKEEDIESKMAFFDKFKGISWIKNFFLETGSFPQSLILAMLFAEEEGENILTVGKVMEEFMLKEDYSEIKNQTIKATIESREKIEDGLSSKYTELIDEVKGIVEQEGSETVFNWEQVKKSSQKKILVAHREKEILVAKRKKKIKNKIVILPEDAEVTFVGDLHGAYNFFDAHLLEMIEKIEKENRIYVFMGDVIDRGDNVVDVLMTLFRLKTLYPDNIVILKGNHEMDTQVNFDSLLETLKETKLFEDKKEAPAVCKAIFEIFNELPILLLNYSEEKDRLVFSMHGGLPVKEEKTSEGLKFSVITNLEDMLEKEKHLLWNDFNGWQSDKKLAKVDKIRLPEQYKFKTTGERVFFQKIIEEKIAVFKETQTGEKVFLQKIIEEEVEVFKKTQIGEKLFFQKIKEKKLAIFKEIQIGKRIYLGKIFERDFEQYKEEEQIIKMPLRLFTLPEKQVFKELSEELGIKNIFVVRGHQHCEMEEAIKGNVVTVCSTPNGRGIVPFVYSVNFKESFTKWDEKNLSPIGQKTIERSA